MISIDWPYLIGSALASLGGLGTVAAAAWFAWSKLRRGKPADPVKAAERSADEPAPEGAVAWAEDICKAMGSAPDSSKLEAILLGFSRDRARSLRIEELEAKP